VQLGINRVFWLNYEIGENKAAWVAACQSLSLHLILHAVICYGDDGFVYFCIPGAHVQDEEPLPRSHG
jgi:hypothetical protein